jgi:hypothetical protein
VAGASQIGGDIVLWKPVEYVHHISRGQYKHVMITGETEHHNIAVEEVLSLIQPS